MRKRKKERKKRRRNMRKRKNMSMCKNKVNSPVLKNALGNLRLQD
jgi:hypothetical protein